MSNNTGYQDSADFTRTNNINGIEEFSKAYRNSNSWEVIDPVDLKSLIDKLEKEITIFENEVDVVLSESNATTFIEVE